MLFECTQLVWSSAAVFFFLSALHACGVPTCSTLTRTSSLALTLVFFCFARALTVLHPRVLQNKQGRDTSTASVEHRGKVPRGAWRMSWKTRHGRPHYGEQELHCRLTHEERHPGRHSESHEEGCTWLARTTWERGGEGPALVDNPKVRCA